MNNLLGTRPNATAHVYGVHTQGSEAEEAGRDQDAGEVDEIGGPGSGEGEVAGNLADVLNFAILIFLFIL